MPVPGKQPLRLDRIRQFPTQFSWIDWRLIRYRLVEGLSTDAIALYLVLVCVGDRLGLSFYGDRRLCRMLGIDSERLHQSRTQLCSRQLIAYRYPLYQVLELPLPQPGESGPVRPPRRGKTAVRLGDLLGHAVREPRQ
jgi:hypothetical protein